MRLKALIFDVDGTLAETEEGHRAAFNAAFAAAGLGWHWSEATYARLLTTTGGKERIARHMAEIGAEGVDIPSLHADKTARYAALVAAGGVALRPGIAEVIALARAGGLRLGIATTTSRPNVEALAQAAFGRAAGEVFDVLACGDEVPAKKPAPDVYRLSLSRLGLAPDEALAFEDTPMGVASARGAGLRVVASAGVYSRGADLSGAQRIVREFSELLPGGLAGLAAI